MSLQTHDCVIVDWFCSM